jgi:hypothetical protein
MSILPFPTAFNAFIALYEEFRSYLFFQTRAVIDEELGIAW